MALLRIVARLLAPRSLPSVTSYMVGGLLVLNGLGASAQTGPSREYQVKAVFLFNFAQFVEWPAAAFAGAHSPIVIGVLGENPFGEYLDQTVRGEKVENRAFEVHHYLQVDEIKTCHVLFIVRSEGRRLGEVLVLLKNRSTLIVGDGDDFIERGGMIRLATAQNKIRLIINVTAAKAANLTVSSKLLRSAEVMTGSTK